MATTQASDNNRSVLPELEIGQERFSFILPWLVLTISLISTYWVWNSTSNSIHHEAHAEFNSRAAQVASQVSQRLSVYEQVLSGVQGLYVASEEVTRLEFRKYVAALKLADNYPGVQGIGIALIIPPDQLAQHQAMVRADGISNYAIRPSGQRDVYTSIVYLEPMVERNRKALGYDMLSDPIRREAMESARDTGEATLTSKTRLLSENGDVAQEGFLIYLPIYRNGHAHDTLEARRENIIGWAYAPFHSDDFIRGAYDSQSWQADIHLYDSTAIKESTLMYDSIPPELEDIQHQPQMMNTQTLSFAGHNWTLVISSPHALELHLGNKTATWVGVVGIFVSALLTMITWSLLNARRRAVVYAQRVNSELISSEQALRESEAKLQAVLDNAAVAIGWANAQGEIVYINRKFVEMFGYSRGEILSVEAWYLRAYPDEDYRNEVVGEWEKSILDAQQNHDAIPAIELDVTCRDGSVCHAILASAWVGTDILVSFSDITERKQAEKALQDSKTVLQAILDNLPYLVWMKDERGRFVVVNKPYLQSTGYRKTADVLGKKDEDIWPEELAIKYRADDLTVIKQGGRVTREEQRLEDDKLLWIETFRSPVYDDEGTLLGITGFSRDITEHKQEEMRVRHQAQHDALTGLPNRTLFSDRVQQALLHAKRGKKQFAVLFLDLDQFKPVNDTYGHVVGDLLLQDVANRLRSCLRESDTVARIGGDEFCVLLCRIESEKDVTTVADKIVQTIQKPYDLLGHQLSISTSIGISMYPQDGEDEQTLIKRADVAMYFAKESGSGNIKFHSASSIHKPDGLRVIK